MDLPERHLKRKFHGPFLTPEWFSRPLREPDALLESKFEGVALVLKVFFFGLFSGCTIMLALAFTTVLHVLFANMSESEWSDWVQQYMMSVFPIFSMTALVVLHLFLYGVNIYLWQRTCINYAFILEFAPGTAMSYQDVFLVCTTLSCLLGGGMLGHLASHYSESLLWDLIPLGVVLTFFTLLFWPFDCFYRSSRTCFQNCIFRIICAPFYEVLLADFFLGDQLCSQVSALRSLEYFVCYYFGGYFKSNDGQACLVNDFFLDLSYAISVLPYWWRLLQCCRRFRDEKDSSHLVNGGKYLSALLVVCVRTRYGLVDNTKWMLIYLISSTLATFYQIYWDVVRDWGLLNRTSVNPWLRDDLILEDHKYIYFLSMGLNVLLRFPWILSVTNYSFGGIDSRLIDFFFAVLEVIRRGHWNFYRLENEHLTNVGHYRAIKTVPLPFVS